MTTIDLGTPTTASPSLTRRACRQVMVAVGGGAPVSVQSMTTTPTADIDIHFHPRYVFAAIAAGCAAIRVNPTNPPQRERAMKASTRPVEHNGFWRCSAGYHPHFRLRLHHRCRLPTRDGHPVRHLEPGHRTDPDGHLTVHNGR